MRLPRIMIAAPGSGSGKTIITCGILSLLKNEGTDIASFKCGPDYIDPMFHRSVIGVPGGNLDAFFSSDEELRSILAASEHEAAVIEGVMGIYDGISGAGEGRTGSCYEVAGATGTPVILAVDVSGMGQTMISVIKGILLDDKECLIRGIILNRISERYYGTISPMIEDALAGISGERGTEVRLLGGIPNSADIHLESRHLGLLMPGDIDDLRGQVDAAADLIRSHIDIDILKGIMESAAELPERNSRETAECSDAPVLAVARDEAFCFYYEENLRMLEAAGIRISEFSPLRDESIPADADGILLGGGYPELYADRLSANRCMLESIRNAIGRGMPSLAECGGFMYLMDELWDKPGKAYRMAGVIPGRSYYTGKLVRFGYVTVSAGGLSFRGHEFHYYDSSNNGQDAAAVRPGSGNAWECMHIGEDHIWGFPHLYYPSCPELVQRMRAAMAAYRNEQLDKSKI